MNKEDFEKYAMNSGLIYGKKIKFMVLRHTYKDGTDD